MQPPSNRFLRKDESADDMHLLQLGACRRCGHIQLINPMSVEMVSPRVDWIFYNEPEGHLDDVVNRFTQLPSISKQSKIFGLTYKEDTTLERLNNLGFANTFRYDPVKHLNLANSAGLETIQSVVKPELAASLALSCGQADLIFVRHILEHAHDPVEFTNAIKKLVKDDGYIVFEVPDSERFMTLNDYPFIWEEHISYFVETSIRQFIKEQNLELIDFLRYPYTFEDSLIVITRQSKDKLETVENGNKQYMDIGHQFAKSFSDMKKQVQNKLRRYKDNGKKVGVFGGGHLAVKFLNFFELSELVDVVIDDHPDKQGLFMPGCGIAIVSSKKLQDIDLCLLSLSPESEQKILDKFKWYQDSRGVFKSIFAASPISIFE